MLFPRTLINLTPVNHSPLSHVTTLLLFTLKTKPKKPQQPSIIRPEMTYTTYSSAQKDKNGTTVYGMDKELQAKQNAKYDREKERQGMCISS